MARYMFTDDQVRLIRARCEELVPDIDKQDEHDHPVDREAILEEARDVYQDDDCEIDDDAQLSQSDCGWWVQAWVFVYDRNQEG